MDVCCGAVGLLILGFYALMRHNFFRFVIGCCCVEYLLLLLGRFRATLDVVVVIQLLGGRALASVPSNLKALS